MSVTFFSTSKSESYSDSEDSGSFLFFTIGVLFGLESPPTVFTLHLLVEGSALGYFSVLYTSSVSFSLAGLCETAYFPFLFIILFAMLGLTLAIRSLSENTSSSSMTEEHFAGDSSRILSEI